MVECKFIYQNSSGASSDSLVEILKVQAVPSVGDRLTFIGANGNSTENVVKAVAHIIAPESGSHEIIVYYGG
jgi:ABC-type polysaccharide/polyol phosphate transport system ATPase subunit